MLGGGTRDARRTERYLDGLVAADERRVSEVPADADLDPAIRLAARELRCSLTRVHPSFRFEESLAARLSAGATRLKAGLEAEEALPATPPGIVAPFPGRAEDATSLAATQSLEAAQPFARAHAAWPPAALRRLPEMSGRSSRPLIVGGVGVGVASAAISIGAVYVAWRHSHPAPNRMGRAAREAHSRTGNSGHGRRAGVINGILGVVS
jgi:hypothetical protein